MASTTIDRESKERSLDAILKSRTFARSEQLQVFLKYICGLELADRGSEISEYSIATAALNRPLDYAPSEDSSVRSRAHALRRKLKEFYESEAPEAEIYIELPKGSYRPIFLTRVEPSLPSPRPIEAPSPASVPPLLEPSAAAPFSRKSLLFLVMGVTAVIACAILAAIFWASRADGSVIDPVIREAWGPALARGSDVLIVVGCPPVLRMVPGYPGLQPRPSNTVEASPEISGWYTAQHLENRGGPLYIFPNRGSTVLSDTLAVTQVGAVASVAGASYQVIPEPSVRPMAIHERGLVLIGSPASAPFIDRLLKLMPFSIRFDHTRNDEVISEGPPETSRTVFTAKRGIASNRFSKVYGLITVLPSQPGRERPERTLIFSGITGSPGAQAAVQFFSSPVAMGELKERFRREGHKGFPPAYQVIVRCGVDNEAAMNSVYEAHRIMSVPPVIE